MDAAAHRFAAGAVDIISFATLGGVFASAMTGNFALLAYYVAQSDSQSAMARSSRCPDSPLVRRSGCSSAAAARRHRRSTY